MSPPALPDGRSETSGDSRERAGARPDTPGAASERYEIFLVEVVVTKVVWGLRNDVGWANRSTTSEPVAPFWSDREAAQRCAQETFPGYEPEEIPLQEFVEDWVPELERLGLWVGVNLSPAMAGIEVPPSHLARALMQTVT